MQLKRSAKAAGGFYVEPEAKLAFVIRIKGLNKIHPKVRSERGDAAATAGGRRRRRQRLFFRPSPPFGPRAKKNPTQLTPNKKKHQTKTHNKTTPNNKPTKQRQTKKILQLLRLRQINNGVFLQINKATLGMLKRVEPYIAWGYPNLKTVRELLLKRGHAKVNGNRLPLTDNKLIEQHLGKKDLLCLEDLVHEVITVGPNFKDVTNFLWPFKLNAPRGGLAKKRVHYVEGGQAGNREDKINALVRRMN